MPIQNSSLLIHGIFLDPFVGCLPEERLSRQGVEVDIDLFFKEPPKGCISDCLSDTVCYALCVEIVRKTANKKHFDLIEHLAFEIHSALTAALPKEVSIRVRVTKLHPPIAEVKKGVSFTYG